MISSRETKTALYRFYDAEKVLFYVGITNDPPRRWREHARDKYWYSQVKHQTVTWYDSEPLARAAERRAIKGERPRFNVAGAPDPIPVRFAVRSESVLCTCIAAMTVAGISASISLWVPSWRGWMDPICVPAIWTFAASVLALGLTMIPTSIRRLGVWLERHIVPML